MNTKFMGGTSLAHTEIEMQRIPGFHPRRSGMMVSRFPYVPIACDCPCHTLKAEKKTESSRADCVPFSALLDKLSAEVGVRPFVTRVSRLSARESPFFGSEQHRNRFLKIWQAHKKVSGEAAMCAAVYLLSADTFLWGKSVSAIKPDFIDFPAIRIHGVDLDGYVMFHTAKDLYKGTKHISLSELTDPELVSDMLSEQIREKLKTGLTSAQEIKCLIFERARQQYQRSEINDDAYQTEKIKQILADIGQQPQYNDTLFEHTIRQVMIYEEGKITFHFLNGIEMDVYIKK